MAEVINATIEDKEYIWKHYKTNEKEIKENVKLIKEWMRQQQHLPQIADEDLIEILFLRNKCRIESTKSCIDSFYTVRSIYPELFSDLDKSVPSKEPLLAVCTRTLSSQKEILVVLKLNTGPDDFNFLSFAKHFVANQLLYNESDYSLGCHILFDTSQATLGHLTKVVPFTLKKILDIALKIFKQRIKGIYIYNPPTWISLFFDMIKPFMPSKIYNRISLHSTTESLLEVVEKELLPSDYGGTNKSLAELADDHDKLFVMYKQFLRDVPKIKTNEKLRIGKCAFDTDLYGVEGTFRKINLD